MAYFMNYPLQKMEALLETARHHQLTRGKTFSNLTFPPIKGDNSDYGALVVKPGFIDEVVTSIPRKDAQPGSLPEPYSSIISVMPAGDDAVFYRQPRGSSVAESLKAAGYAHKKTIANDDGVTIETFVLGNNIR